MSFFQRFPKPTRALKSASSLKPLSWSLSMPSRQLCIWPFSGAGKSMTSQFILFFVCIFYVFIKLLQVSNNLYICICSIFFLSHTAMVVLCIEHWPFCTWPAVLMPQHVMVVFGSQACWAAWKLLVCCWIVQNGRGNIHLNTVN